MFPQTQQGIFKYVTWIWLGKSRHLVKKKKKNSHVLQTITTGHRQKGDRVVEKQPGVWCWSLTVACCLAPLCQLHPLLRHTMSSCHLFLSILDSVEGLDQGESSCEFKHIQFCAFNLFIWKKKSEYDKYASKKKLINCLIKKEEPCGTWKLNTTTKVFLSGTVIDYCCL